ncbi:hypothetical protein BC832DRAFT_542617 [Gaertneriomyces semiglobifer]|nr:hypothetical protein BC832DRAFT_542617 [Gaertneriomyces semiglobifer]
MGGVDLTIRNAWCAFVVAGLVPAGAIVVVSIVVPYLLLLIFPMAVRYFFEQSFPARNQSLHFCLQVAENRECNQSARDVADRLLERHEATQQALPLSLCGPAPASTTAAIHGSTNIRAGCQGSIVMQIAVSRVNGSNGACASGVLGTAHRAFMVMVMQATDQDCHDLGRLQCGTHVNVARLILDVTACQQTIITTIPWVPNPRNVKLQLGAGDCEECEVDLKRFDGRAGGGQNDDVPPEKTKNKNEQVCLLLSANTTKVSEAHVPIKECGAPRASQPLASEGSKRSRASPAQPPLKVAWEVQGLRKNVCLFPQASSTPRGSDTPWTQQEPSNHYLPNKYQSSKKGMLVVFELVDPDLVSVEERVFEACPKGQRPVADSVRVHQTQYGLDEVAQYFRALHVKLRA